MESYDLVRTQPSEELKKLYIRRQRFMRIIEYLPFEIDVGNGWYETFAIRFVRELIAESLEALPSVDLDKTIPSNVKHIERIVEKTGVLINTFKSLDGNKDPVHDEVQLVRVVLAHLHFRASSILPYCFEFSQQAVYGEATNRY